MICIGCSSGAGSGSRQGSPATNALTEYTQATASPAGGTDPTTIRGTDVSLVQKVSIVSALGTVFAKVPADAGPDPIEATVGNLPRSSWPCNDGWSPRPG